MKDGGPGGATEKQHISVVGNYRKTGFMGKNKKSCILNNIHRFLHGVDAMLSESMKGRLYAFRLAYMHPTNVPALVKSIICVLRDLENHLYQTTSLLIVST